MKLFIVVQKKNVTGNHVSKCLVTQELDSR